LPATLRIAVVPVVQCRQFIAWQLLGCTPSILYLSCQSFEVQVGMFYCVWCAH